MTDAQAKLTATGGNQSAGIGGGGLWTVDNVGSGTITINGGTIIATGGPWGAGIGGGYAGRAGTTTINGGVVTANGYWATGIGSGYSIGGGDGILINGGSVTVNGSERSAIESDHVAISGGTVTAIGGTTTFGINAGTLEIDDSASVKAYSQTQAISATIAATGHTAYLLNFSLDTAVAANTDIVITKQGVPSEEVLLTLPSGYLSFATTVATSNSYTAALADGSKIIAAVSDESTEFIGVLQAPGSSVSSYDVKLMDVPAPAPDVAQIVSTSVKYTSLTDALAAVPDGGTIKLLADISYNAQIAASGKSFTLQLDGHTLSVAVSLNSDAAMKALGGTSAIHVTGGGVLAVRNSAANGIGLWINSPGNLISIDPGTAVTMEAGDVGVYAQQGTVNFSGNITAGNKGISVDTNGTVTVTGSITTTGNSGSFGIYASDGARATLNGDINAGNINACGAYATFGAAVTVTGNVTSSLIGAAVSDGGTITVDGAITAFDDGPNYLQVNGSGRSKSSSDASTTKDGYLTYSGGTCTIWVKTSTPAPAITSVAAGTETLAASGGTSLITVSGTNLTNGITVKCFRLGTDTAAGTGSTTGSAASQTVTLTFPSNTGSSDRVYTVKASFDGGTTWDAHTATVTVAKPVSDVPTGGGGGTPADSGTKVTVSTTDGSASVEGTLTQTDGGAQIAIKNDAFDKIDAADKPASVDAQLATVTFDKKAINTIGAATGSGDVTLTVRQVPVSELSAAKREIVGSRPVYDFTITGGGKTISNFNGGHATISLPYTLTAGENPHAIVVWYLSDSGKLVGMQGHYNAATKTVVFTTPHFLSFVVGYNLVTFSDVASGAWYHDAVTFIAARGITTGTTATAFSPDSTLTRGQFAVMLLRAYGIEPDSNAADNFSDAGSTYYTGYLAAAKQLGISNGVGNNMFAPDQSITRQEMFTLLYNALKEIDALPIGTSGKTLADFSDASGIASWAKDAMTALVKAGTVTGSDSKLNPTGTTTRAEMAQVLYNLSAK